ncbi:AraC family transcriptional regulator (plasmid) [Methylocystis parvus OBBP]|uniref:Helix-turn-helix transcriptional regulator n=2 Tax=Methylocystis parvus TaxID=134 RepID=A0A6B8MB83_9HYPH|nr:AraC family transcriptional regulator [Methylocystis parvus]QGM99956.1 helix-turn-helix transcriptional regulator [Methylocystis parvus]WBK02184.1 AraC family transcriptional regulator [Methylocystis parvus OBBP]
MLNLSQAELAERAGISVETLKRLLGVRAGISVGQGVSEDAMAKARSALEAAGVEFIPENGGGAGVRLKKGHANGMAKQASE